MNTPNAELMREAREALKGKWGEAALATFIFFLVSGGVSLIPHGIGDILSFILTGPFALGVAALWLRYARKQDTPLETIFSGFKNFLTAFLTYFLMLIFIILWLLLLIVPGIMASFSYALTFNILADNPEMKALDAIRKSKELMYGNRMKLFFLSCRFIGWVILGILTLGIGLLWVMPYMYVSLAKFYEDVKDGTSNSTPAPSVPSMPHVNEVSSAG